MSGNGIDWRDSYVTIFVDEEKYMVVFLNDRGDTKAICWDDNFYYIESLVDTYFDMIVKSFTYWHGNDIEQDFNDIKKHLVLFIRHLQQTGNEIETELCCKEVRKLLG